MSGKFDAWGRGAPVTSQPTVNPARTTYFHAQMGQGGTVRMNMTAWNRMLAQGGDHEGNGESAATDQPTGRETPGGGGDEPSSAPGPPRYLAANREYGRVVAAAGRCR